ncbi:MAG: US12 family protein [Bacilli bacterium]|nr:US12 family protein [Bacilli bacterium]
MPTFNSFDSNNNSSSQQVVYDFTDKQSKGTFLSKVFGLMFICLLITTAVAAGLGYGIQALILNSQSYDPTAPLETLPSNILTVFLIMVFVSAIGLIVMSFVLPITFARGKHNIFVPLMIYVVLMGILLSLFTFLFDWLILVEAFGITTLIFGLMAFLGYISKGRLTGIGFILLGLMIGALALSLINWMMILIGGIKEQNIMISWIVSLIVFAFLMLVTLYDVYRIKKIAEAGATHDNNLTYYCAYILYSDFIAILIRVVYYLAILTGGRRK